MERLIQTLASMLLVIPLGVAAQEVGSLELMTTVEKVAEILAADGTLKTELLPVETAVPGEEVVYTVTFTNVGEETAENIRITNPIPEEMRYIPGSAFGPGTDVVYSADGGESYAPPEELLVASADGSRRRATPEDYTHIRWVLNAPLDAGAKGFARFRAVLR